MAAGGVEAAAVRARCVKTLGRSVACCSPGRRVHSTATMVTEVESMDQFKKELKDAGDKLVVVDFTASWCGPCKMISPYYKQLSEDAEFSEVVFLKLDIDKVDDVAQSCGISAMPTFQFYKNGNMDQFKKELKDAGDKLVVVGFKATWCGPCKLIGPYYDFYFTGGQKYHKTLLSLVRFIVMLTRSSPLQQLSESAEFSDVVFLQVDIDEAARDVAQSCEISAMPTFQFYKNGNMVDHFTGASRDKLLQFLRRLK
ncbi:hypothetical protein F2P81_018309 [Scophthalmus maximus]|uniref:Thioredoxin domain-containing protein n=1 Tax=Scophthalmus maximus TaxID=52904 RepID=A0A6A4SE91_SCOMX|nr:hypothetical protein F2P81_018309 [Scophthalmus maximus]